FLRLQVDEHRPVVDPRLIDEGGLKRIDGLAAREGCAEVPVVSPCGEVARAFDSFDVFQCDADAHVVWSQAIGDDAANDFGAKLALQARGGGANRLACGNGGDLRSRLTADALATGGLAERT